MKVWLTSPITHHILELGASRVVIKLTDHLALVKPEAIEHVHGTFAASQACSGDHSFLSVGERVRGTNMFPFARQIQGAQLVDSAELTQRSKGRHIQRSPDRVGC